MKKLSFCITIDAPREKVWNIIIGKDTYPQWTAPFAEGSQAETDWKKGSKALFLDGKGNGMVSEIVENRPGEFLSIRHYGAIKNGVEDTTSEEVKKWANAMENYTLETLDGKTVWTVDMDITGDFAAYMEKTWPLAQAKVKDLSEKN